MPKNKKNVKVKYGKVGFCLEYVVDLSNEDMINEAKTCLYEDILSSIKYGAIEKLIDVTPDPTASEGDIPDFLKGRTDDDDWI